jgi:transcriptional regulator with XRE-family HTH domain
METTILSSSQASKARLSLSISQGKLASDLGINRSYLSQFESGKRLLNDDVLIVLREYFENNGYLFDDIPDSQNNIVTTMDGFVIPEAIGVDEANITLSEYAENFELIKSLSEVQINFESGFFSDDQIDEKDKLIKTRKVLCLMARNFLLVTKLHGKDIFGSESNHWQIENSVGACIETELMELTRVNSPMP